MCIRDRHKSLLDEAAPDNPLVLQHASGHTGVFNTLALRELGVQPGTPAPAGGAIGVENGELTGYMAVSYTHLPLEGAGRIFPAFWGYRAMLDGGLRLENLWYLVLVSCLAFGVCGILLKEKNAV